jgi:hypothetical protein
MGCRHAGQFLPGMGNGHPPSKLIKRPCRPSWLVVLALPPVRARMPGGSHEEEAAAWNAAAKNMAAQVHMGLFIFLVHLHVGLKFSILKLVLFESSRLLRRKT